jgi:hypothetical protein
MALAVLSVLAEGSTDTEAMGRAMVRWHESEPVDVGNQTSAVLGEAAGRGTHPSVTRSYSRRLAGRAEAESLGEGSRADHGPAGAPRATPGGR